VDDSDENAMPLPDHFQFSQSSLQDYVECARRFELCYIDSLLWPAVEAEPIVERERHLQRGADFHHLIHQCLLGVPAEALAGMTTDAELRRWWEAYLRDPLVNGLPKPHYPEILLSTSLGGHRLLAKYDLIAIQPGERALIFDWKTSQRRLPRARLASRLQTIVYRYVLVEAGAFLNGGQTIAPAQVEMIYWFAVDPADPERFEYNEMLHRENGDYLAGLIAEIKQRRVFDLTTETQRCQFCRYRSLCERGNTAGNADELDADWDDASTLSVDFDFDDIAEIEF